MPHRTHVRRRPRFLRLASVAAIALLSVAAIDPPQAHAGFMLGDAANYAVL
jgi:hypothetical protein